MTNDERAELAARAADLEAMVDKLSTAVAQLDAEVTRLEALKGGKA